MRRLLALLLIALPAFGQFEIRRIAKTSVGGGGGGSSFSDDFNRANGAIGSNWSCFAGGGNITSNTATFTATSFAENGCVWSAATTGSPNHFVKVQFPSGSARYPRIYFRYTDATSPCYFLQLEISSETWEWYQKPVCNGATENLIQAQAAVASGINTYGMTVDGTGTATVVRLWRTPTGNAPDSGGATWNSASPTWSFTTDPASAVDTGNSVGIGGVQSSAGEIIIDNFYGGPNS